MSQGKRIKDAGTKDSLEAPRGVVTTERKIPKLAPAPGDSPAKPRELTSNTQHTDKFGRKPTWVYTQG